MTDVRVHRNSREKAVDMNTETTNLSCCDPAVTQSVLLVATTKIFLKSRRHTGLEKNAMLSEISVYPRTYLPPSVGCYATYTFRKQTAAR